MDEKVLVEVCVPAAQQCFDVVLPTAFRIKQIKDILLPMVQECTNGAFIFKKESVFYLTRIQMNLWDEQVVKDIGIKNADEIIIW